MQNNIYPLIQQIRKNIFLKGKYTSVAKTLQILARLQYTKDRPGRHPNVDHAASRSEGC